MNGPFVIGRKIEGRRGAFTLFEVVLAMGIFMVLVVGISQALISTRNFVGEDEIRNDLELEGLRLMRDISGDLGNSAWFQQAPGGTVVNQPEPKVITPMTYPNVGKGSAGKGTTAWGDQLDFVKLRLKAGTWTSPTDMRYSDVKARISLTNSAAVGMDDIFSAPTLISLVGNPDWSPGVNKSTPFVWPVFESAVAPLSYSENESFDVTGRSPRLYRYIVRNLPGFRNGRLIRQYSNSPGPTYASIPEYAKQIVNVGDVIVPPPVTSTPNPWVDDVVLSDNIKATDDPDFPDLIGTPGVKFDTFLTDSAVKYNEIRIRLILVRDPAASLGGTRVTRTVQTSIAMRSVTY